MDEILRLEHLEKTFGTHQVLRDISFSVNKGDVIMLASWKWPTMGRLSPVTLSSPRHHI